MLDISERDLEALRGSAAFDADWYIDYYPDVAKGGFDPAYHYLWLGWRLGRRPSKRVTLEFDAQEYLDTDPDVVQSGMNPVAHYLAYRINAMPAILDSGLFEADWYSAQYGMTGSDQQLVQDYLKTSMQDPLRQPGSLFSGAFYSLVHADTRLMNPLAHYVCHGMREGRRGFESTAADVFMTQAIDQPVYTFRDFLEAGKPVIILHWKSGNFFFTDIAQYVAEVLADAGFDVRLLDDHRGLVLDDTEIIVVAPHEYCVHGPGTAFTPEIAARVVHVNLEQWHTSWFSLALDKMLTSRKALDINPLSARGLSRLGIKAGFLPLLPRKDGVFDFGQELPSQQLMGLRAIKPLTYPRKPLDRPMTFYSWVI